MWYGEARCLELSPKRNFFFKTPKREREVRGKDRCPKKEWQLLRQQTSHGLHGTQKTIE